MNSDSKALKLDWTKIVIVAIVLAIAGYRWYTGNELTDPNAGPDTGQLSADSTGRDDGDPTKTKSSQKNETAAPEKSDPAEAYLQSAGGDNLKSPAGLIYTAGRSEHRADHVLRHAHDIPDRPGTHGVFHANDDDVFRLLDEAYALIKSKSKRVKTEPSDDGRTEYVIDMKREVGFKGGQTGQRQNHPKLNKIKLVLSDNRVITAFPY